MLIVDFNARLEELDRLNRQAEITRLEATHAGLTQMAYQTQIAYATSGMRIEEEARSNAGMIQDGDHPVVVLGDGNETPVQAPEPTPLPTPKPNWQIWWNLYFGEE